jgi:hypothetical protein
MNDELLNPSDLRDQGFKALVAALGWVNAVRFMQQFDRSSYNYTVERHQILPDWDARELVARSQQVKRKLD